MAAGAVVAWFILFLGQVPLVSLVATGLVTLLLFKVYYDAAKDYYDTHGYPGWE